MRASRQGGHNSRAGEAVVTPGRRGRYSTEFKAEAAHQVIDSRRSVAEVARELNVGVQSLGSWVRDERRRRAAARGSGLEPLTGAERTELEGLRKQVADLEKDVLFLGKASAYFASNPPRRSGSR